MVLDRLESAKQFGESYDEGNQSSKTRTKGDHGPINFDPIRKQSGEVITSSKMPITFDNSCLIHQKDTHDRSMFLKFFKMACLAYQPSSVTYRSN